MPGSFFLLNLDAMVEHKMALIQLNSVLWLNSGQVCQLQPQIVMRYVLLMSFCPPNLAPNFLNFDINH